MRPSPELAGGRSPIQSALARVRLPTGPRVCELAAIGVCALVAALVLTPLTLQHELPNAYDTDAFYAPFAAFLDASLARGDFPLWNPFAFSGQPFAADPQAGVLYPPALLSYGLLAPAGGMVAIVTFDYLLATLSSYAFARLIGAGRLGAVYAGIAFGAGGYLIARSQALGLLAGAAWLAACVAAAQYAARREGKGASVLPLAAALALSVLGGSQQLTAVAATSALVLLVLQLRWRGLAIFAGAGAAAAALAAVAILPRLELVSRSTAANGVSDPAGVGTLEWSDAKLILGSFGTHAGELAPLYAGALTPALAVIALVRRWSQARIPFALAIVAILWSAGLAGFLAEPFGPLRSITAHQAVRALPLLALALAALAGLAFGRPGARPSPWAVGALAVVIALIARPDALEHKFYVGPALAMLAVLALLRSRRTSAAVLACALVPGVLAIDLARHGYTQRNPHQPAARWHPAAETFPGPPATARFLLARRAADGPTRFATLANDFTLRKQLRFGRSPEHRDLLLGMAGTRYGLEDVAGYDPLQLLRYRDAITESNGNPQSDRHFLWVEVAPKRLLRLLGVRYYVAQEGQVLRKLTVVMRTPTATVLRDDKALPIARVNRPGRTDAARIVVREPDRVVVETPAGPAGRLVLADPPYPGWQVTVDGKRAPTRVQNGLFRAVDLPAGSHRVEWRFSPHSVRLGLVISIATIVLAIAYGLSMWRRERALAHVGQRSESTSGARPWASSAGGALGQIESATTRPLAASARHLLAHALDAPAAGRGEARVRRQRRVEHVGVDVHVERRVGGSAASASAALRPRAAASGRRRRAPRDRGRGRPRAPRAPRAAAARGPAWRRQSSKHQPSSWANGMPPRNPLGVVSAC